jgi:sec-independent protein translocase protein TatB
MVAMELTVLALKALPGAAAALLPHAPRILTASIGIPDTLFLMLLALVVFGPRRLPEIGRQIGKLMYEFRKVSNDFKFQMEEELRASEEADRLKKVQAAFQTPIQPVLSAPAAPALEAGSETVPAVVGEVRAETPKTPQIAPPSTGEPIAAPRPFRQNFSEPQAEHAAEHATEPAVELNEGAEQEVQHG